MSYHITKKSLHYTDIFCTVSDKMRLAYQEYFNRDSFVMINMSESLYNSEYRRNAPDKDFISIVYTGSLYYGRDKTIGLIADAVKKYNASSLDKNFLIEVYSNTTPDARSRNNFERSGTSFFRGSLNKDELIKILNNADILLFIESFESTYVSKVKYSLSTKIPEYLSLEKPILAVGSCDSSSIQYLQDVAFCITNQNEILEKVYQYFQEFQEGKDNWGLKAREKYKRNHKKQNLQEKFKKLIEK